MEITDEDLWQKKNQNRISIISFTFQVSIQGHQKYHKRMNNNGKSKRMTQEKEEMEKLEKWPFAPEETKKESGEDEEHN